MIFDWFKSKEKLVRELDELKAEKESYTGVWRWLDLGFEIASLKNNVLQLKSINEQLNGQLQDKNQRIAELQQMLLEVQKERLNG